MYPDIDIMSHTRVKFRYSILLDCSCLKKESYQSLMVTFQAVFNDRVLIFIAFWFPFVGAFQWAVVATHSTFSLLCSKHFLRC